MRKTTRPLIHTLSFVLLLGCTSCGKEEDDRLAPAVAIPLREGLTIVTAVTSAPGDYESIKRIDSVAADRVRFTYAAEHSDGDGGRTQTRTRRVLRRCDLETARIYRQGFGNNDEDEYPGSTALGASALILEELKARGSTEFKVTPGGVQGLLGSAIGGMLGMDDEELTLVKGTLTRAGSVRVPVVVNDQPTLLPAIQARGRFGGSGR